MLHELNHHIALQIDKDTDLSLETIIDILENSGVDRSYMANFEDLWTDLFEFKDITGLCVKEGRLKYDITSEGAYNASRGKGMRACHSRNRVRAIPIEIMEKVKEGNPNVSFHTGRRHRLFPGWI